MSSTYVNSYLYLNSGSVNFDYQSPTFKQLGNQFVHVCLGGAVNIGDVMIYKSKRIWKKDDTVYIELPAQFSSNGIVFDINAQGDNVVEITKSFARTHKFK